jgi:hypothetical protein
MKVSWMKSVMDKSIVNIANSIYKNKAKICSMRCFYKIMNEWVNAVLDQVSIVSISWRKHIRFWWDNGNISCELSHNSCNLLFICKSRSIKEYEQKMLGSVRIIYPSGATCLYAGCCYSELALDQDQDSLFSFENQTKCVVLVHV